MIELSSKLSSFRKLVWDVEKRKSEKELYDIVNSSADLLDKKKLELNNALDTYLEKRKVFATTKKNEMVAEKSEEEKNIFYRYKENLLKEILVEIKEQLLSYSKTDEYKNKLVEDVNKQFKKIKELSDEKFILMVKKEDQDLFDEYETLVMDDSKIGGFIFKNSDMTYEYDFSLKRKLDNKKYEIGKKLYSLLEESEVDQK